MRQKIDLGSGLVALGALVLVVSLFLSWYAKDVTAFDAFEVVDWALLGLAIVTVAGVLLSIRDATAPPRWLPVVVLAAAYLVAAQLIDPPPLVRGHTREIGAWLALASVAAMAAGLALSAASISVTVDVRGRDRRRRMPAVDRRAEAPPPPPSASPLRPTPSPPPPPRTPRTDPERTEPLRPLQPRPAPGDPETSET